MPKKREMVFFTIFISVFYLAGFAILGFGIWAARRSTHAATWPTTEGVLDKIVLTSKSGTDEKPTYQVQVEYTYTVDGTEYHGSRLAYGYVASTGYEVHKEIHDKLKDAEIVDVRYDPNDPATSTLSFGIHRSIRFILGFAITWLSFIIGFTLVWYVAVHGDDVLLQNLSVR